MDTVPALESLGARLAGVSFRGLDELYAAHPALPRVMRAPLIERALVARGEAGRMLAWLCCDAPDPEGPPPARFELHEGEPVPVVRGLGAGASLLRHVLPIPAGTVGPAPVLLAVGAVELPLPSLLSRGGVLAVRGGPSVLEAARRAEAFARGRGRAGEVTYGPLAELPTCARLFVDGGFSVDAPGDADAVLAAVPAALAALSPAGQAVLHLASTGGAPATGIADALAAPGVVSVVVTLPDLDVDEAAMRAADARGPSASASYRALRDAVPFDRVHRAVVLAVRGEGPAVTAAHEASDFARLPLGGLLAAAALSGASDETLDAAAVALPAGVEVVLGEPTALELPWGTASVPSSEWAVLAAVHAAGSPARAAAPLAAKIGAAPAAVLRLVRTVVRKALRRGLLEVVS